MLNRAWRTSLLDKTEEGYKGCRYKPLLPSSGQMDIERKLKILQKLNSGSEIINGKVNWLDDMIQHTENLGEWKRVKSCFQVGKAVLTDPSFHGGITFMIHWYRWE